MFNEVFVNIVAL